MENLPKTNLPTEPDACSERDKTRKPARHLDGKFLPGASGNLKGRPPGVFTHASALVRTLLEESAARLTNKAIEQALDGNPIALKLCLDRLAAPAQSRAVQFDLAAKPRNHVDAAQTPDQILAQHNAVLQSVADGQLTPQEGQQISAIMDSHRRSWEASVLADRISSLEDKAADLKRAPRKPTIRWVEDAAPSTANQTPAKSLRPNKPRQSKRKLP